MTETVTKKCCFCDNETTVTVDSEMLSAWQNGLNIVAAFPNLNSFQRETLITGMCTSCQERVFHCPTPEHEADWGKVLGTCNCCECSIYSIQDATDEEYDGQKVLKCSSCGTRHILVNDNELEEIDTEEE